MGADFLRVLFEVLPELTDILAQLAHHHVAAVESEIEEALGSALRRKPGLASRPIVQHHGTGRLLGVGIGMAQQDLAQGHAMPGITRRDLAVEKHRAILAGGRGVEGNRLRQPVGEAEMLVGNAIGVEVQVELEAADDRDVVGRQRLRDLIRPRLDLVAILVIEQQQRMDGEARRHLTRCVTCRHDHTARQVYGLHRAIVLHRRVAAPERPILDDGTLPLALDSVAQAAEPVLLVHALAERRRKARQRVGVQARFTQARPSEGDGRRPRVLAVAVGDGRDGTERLQPGAFVRWRVRWVIRPAARQEQRLGRRQVDKPADDDALRLRVVRRRELPARRLRRLPRWLAGGLTGHRSRTHTAASCSLNVSFRRPSAMRALRSICSTVRSR